MAVSPHAFFQFASQNDALLVDLFDRQAVDEGLLHALIERHRGEDDPSPEHIRRRLEELDMLRPAPDADNVFELSRPIAELLGWLLKRQRIASTEVVRGHLAALDRLRAEIESAIEVGEVSTASFAVRDLDHSLESLASLSLANREAVVSEVRTVRTGAETMTAVERFEIVRRLMEGYLRPLEDLVAIHGPVQQRLDALQHVLATTATEFAAHGPLTKSVRRAEARLTRIRGDIVADLLTALHEVAPLYERLRRETFWVRGAALALSAIRTEGAAALRLEARLCIAGWRPRSLVSDERLRARLAALVGYEPAGRYEIAPSQTTPPQPLIPRAELAAALFERAPIDDVLALVLEHWKDAPLKTQLRAYGRIVSGEFGRVDTSAKRPEQRYAGRDVELRARPVRLKRMSIEETDLERAPV